MTEQRSDYPLLPDEDSALLAGAGKENSLLWQKCCDHCGCGTPAGLWPTREGHDDACARGCNDVIA